MAQKVELHGGPRHGQTVDLPYDDAKTMEMDALFNVDGQHLRRRCKYTRVHDVSGKPEPHFEWIGYITAFLPLETDA